MWRQSRLRLVRRKMERSREAPVCCIPKVSATMSHMRRVGVRQLKQNASAVLRGVEAGEPVEVTDRGRPVALLIPIPKQGPLERLIAEGGATVALHRLADLPPPPPPRPGTQLPSATLAALRNNEV